MRIFLGGSHMKVGLRGSIISAALNNEETREFEAWCNKKGFTVVNQALKYCIRLALNAADTDMKTLADKEVRT